MAGKHENILVIMVYYLLNDKYFLHYNYNGENIIFFSEKNSRPINNIGR